MAIVKTADLIAKFQYALNNNFGYILNTWHTQWTQDRQNDKVNSMVSKYGAGWANSPAAMEDDNYTAALYGSKWIGHWVTDCSGLFYWAFKELGGYMYHGSNTMWKKYCTAQGDLKNGKRSDGQTLKPGTAVFVLKAGGNRSHVGLYIGGDTVIEASGTQQGVITTKITNKKWAEWGELKGVKYEDSTPTPVKKEETPMPEENTSVGSAKVNATKVAIRQYPSTNSTVLTRVNEGERVQVLETDWARVSYMGKTGWMMKKFLDN